MTILVTGFDIFGKLAFNPTEMIVAQLAASRHTDIDEELHCHVLPTAYDKAAKDIVALIRETRPSLVLGLGASITRDKICLERFALNLDDAAIEDNIGCVRRGEEIVLGGPAALKTNVDIVAVLNRLSDAGVSAEISNHAGTFVCNHVYYCALRNLEEELPHVRCLFVHVPMPVADSATGQTSSKTPWGMADLLQATRWILAELVRQRGEDSEPGFLKLGKAGQQRFDLQ